MRLKQQLLLALIFLSVFLSTSIGVNAINTRFSTEEVSEAQKNTFISNIKLIVLKTEPTKRGILCFDVNDHGLIAIGQNGTNSKELCVYNSQGVFLYGYAFDCSQSFGIEWDGRLINIFFVRSDILLSLDSAGNVKDIKKVQNTYDNNIYMNSMLDSTCRVVGDTKYLIRNNAGLFNRIATSYSQIVIIDAKGEESVIYDDSSSQLTKTVLSISVIIMFASIAMVVIVWQIIRYRHQKSNR